MAVITSRAYKLLYELDEEDENWGDNLSPNDSRILEIRAMLGEDSNSGPIRTNKYIIYVTDPEGNEKEYPTMAETARRIGVSITAVRKSVVSGKPLRGHIIVREDNPTSGVNSYKEDAVC